eukprot:TRINITY_DN45443_c0_g1_i1.p1 TRINITY_DN45443_c0_g1~~TRINITY_DN45443_c0_g1_i1.p1  ORF type:complete len:529 (+),score=146.84 TRINITY_DN45443_c0_g1_i1:59-1645(+)
MPSDGYTYLVFWLWRGVFGMFQPLLHRWLNVVECLAQPQKSEHDPPATPCSTPLRPEPPTISAIPSRQHEPRASPQEPPAAAQEAPAAQAPGETAASAAPTGLEESSVVGGSSLQEQEGEEQKKDDKKEETKMRTRYLMEKRRGAQLKQRVEQLEAKCEAGVFKAASLEERCEEMRSQRDDALARLAEQEQAAQKASAQAKQLEAALEAETKQASLLAEQIQRLQQALEGGGLEAPKGLSPLLRARRKPTLSTAMSASDGLQEASAVLELSLPPTPIKLELTAEHSIDEFALLSASQLYEREEDVVPAIPSTDIEDVYAKFCQLAECLRTRGLRLPKTGPNARRRSFRRPVVRYWAVLGYEVREEASETYLGYWSNERDFLAGTQCLACIPLLCIVRIESLGTLADVDAHLEDEGGDGEDSCPATPSSAGRLEDTPKSARSSRSDATPRQNSEVGSDGVFGGWCFITVVYVEDYEEQHLVLGLPNPEAAASWCRTFTEVITLHERLACTPSVMGQDDSLEAEMALLAD